jgi:hypothetical protein
MEGVVCPSREIEMRRWIWTVGAKGDHNRRSGPIDLTRAYIGNSGFGNLEHRGGCMPKSRNHEMRRRIWTVGAKGDHNRRSGPIDLMRAYIGNSGFGNLEHRGGCMPKCEIVKCEGGSGPSVLEEISTVDLVP